MVISAASPYTTCRRSVDIDHADAGAGRSTCAGSRHAHAIVFHFDYHAAIGATAANVDAAAIDFVGQAVLDGVFDQRLQNHAGNQMVERGGVKLLHDFQLVAAEARDLDVEIVVEEFEFFAQRHEGVALAQQPPQNVAQLHDHLAGRIWIAPHQRRHRVQGVEQKVGVDLALQGFHARLQQQALLLLQLHLDAHVVQHLQRDRDGHHRSGIDGQRDCPVGGVEREDSARERAVQLNTDELKPQNQEEERGLPVDERLANAAPYPVIDAEIEQRRERPDGFALGRDVAQQAGQHSGQNIHRQRQPLAPEQAPAGKPGCRQRFRQAAADDAHQDGALEGNVGGVEVVHPSRTSTPSAIGVPTMKTISIFSPSVRSSRKSSTRKRRARTSTLLMAAATPSRIRRVTRMRRLVQ